MDLGLWDDWLKQEVGTFFLRRNDMRYLGLLAVAGLVLGFAEAAGAVADQLTCLQNGGDRLVATQNSDGGWGWPVAGASATNTVAPIAMGLSGAYSATGDANQLTALQKAGTFLLAKTNNFSPSDGYLAVELDRVLGGTTYSQYVVTNYYDKLAAGTYNRNGAGTLYNTADYVELIRTSRSGTQANMGAWDIGIGLYAAAKIGADTTAWKNGTETEVNALDAGNYYAQLGLAGSILGLAASGDTSFDPTSGSYASATDVRDLANTLTGYQIGGGGVTWYGGAMDPGNETTQETAYSILAWLAVDSATYGSNVAGAAAWLRSEQLSNGGFGNYAGDAENNEITGEALWAVSATPEPATMLLLGSGFVGLLGVIRRRRGK